MYVYVSNQSDNYVYFDNLQVGITQGNIAEENHYYAFGLKIAALSSRKLGDVYEGALKNNYLYQGQASEWDEEAEWNDFPLRNYDPQIGRWIQQDPYQEFATPYVGMANDPINVIDPSGGNIETLVVTTMGGAIIGTAIHLTSGNDNFKGTLIGASVGLAAGLGLTLETITIGMCLNAVNAASSYFSTRITTSVVGEQEVLTRQTMNKNGSGDSEPEPNQNPDSEDSDSRISKGQIDFGFSMYSGAVLKNLTYGTTPPLVLGQLCGSYKWLKVGKSFTAQIDNQVVVCRDMNPNTWGSFNITFGSTCVTIPEYNVGTPEGSTSAFNTAWNRALNRLDGELNSWFYGKKGAPLSPNDSQYYYQKFLGYLRLELTDIQPGSVVTPKDGCMGPKFKNNISYPEYCTNK